MSDNFIPNPGDVPGEPLDLAAKVSKLSGVAQERHFNMMGEVSKQLGIKPEQVSDIMMLKANAAARIRKVKAHAEECDKLARASAVHTFEQGTQMLGEEVSRRLVEEFHKFTQEELLFVLVLVLTEGIVERFR